MVRAWRLFRALLTDRVYRHVMWLHWTRPRGAFQPFNDTRPDRYPVIFRSVQAALAAQAQSGQPLAILSFGCSTGEEVFSLRRYFPAARIKGIDINTANIAIARKRLASLGDSGLSFAVAASTRGEAAGEYDAIFAMAVLRHGSLGDPGVTRCDHLLRFEDFDHAVADFSRCLRRGGVLAIAHSNFRFSDTAVSADFETVLTMKSAEPRFGRDNIRLDDAGANIGVVFRKR
jgi:2-polyprenyl-3-methyl-5-hydroxy-6-metoxy-1,4-benzoquinol methylase